MIQIISECLILFSSWDFGFTKILITVLLKKFNPYVKLSISPVIMQNPHDLLKLMEKYL